jgi:hypothetical protein
MHHPARPVHKNAIYERHDDRADKPCSGAPSRDVPLFLVEESTNATIVDAGSSGGMEAKWGGSEEMALGFPLASHEIGATWGWGREGGRGCG